MKRESVTIRAGEVLVDGDLTIPEGSVPGLVLFAHGSGSSRMSPRNRYVAGVLADAGLATLLIDLLTTREEERDAMTAELRFDIQMLARRLIDVISWLARSGMMRDRSLGLFGASTGAAAARLAEAELGPAVEAIVARGGRPDLAAPILPLVTAPALFIVGGRDVQVAALNREAMSELPGDKRLDIIPGATHLFEEPGALERVARLARDWFLEYLAPSEVRLPGGEPAAPG